MCGICGELDYSGSASAAAIKEMLGPLEARGPDDFGVFVHGGAGLGHRRLTILDVSDASQQPMVDPTLGLAIVFNGCIYNFRELRSELQQQGYQFFSEGDTEVILKAYHAWGERCVDRLIGMFAFAIWERASGKLILARDRLGIKPLYYSETSKHFRFASTVRALLAAGDVDTSIDNKALHHYMSWHAVVPAPNTILKGIRKLAPATTMTIEKDGRRREQTYWRLPDRKRSLGVQSENEWSELVTDALLRSVKRRTVADVPTGVLLSGGLDSTLIVGMLHSLGHSDINTFSIGFDSVNGVEGDEFKYSDLVARHFGTRHHRIQVTAKDAAEALPGTIAAMSEPMMSHDAVGFYLLSREVSKHVKVVQSGQGADEVFAGYHWYQKLVHSNDVTEDYARIYFDRDHAEMAEALHPSRMNGDYSREFISDFFSRANETTSVDKVLRLDTEIMLVDDPVKRVDNMTMAWGLEGRVPFLDHELVELAAGIPSDLKLKGEGGKYILKKASEPFVPSEIINRSKGYFPVPALKYLRGEFYDFVSDILHQPKALERDVFNRSYIEHLLKNPETSLTPKGNSKLWQVAVLEHWLQAHGV